MIAQKIDDRRHALSERHRERADRIGQQTQHVGTLASDQIAHLAADQDERRRNQSLEGDRRLHAARRRVEILDDSRDRDVHQRRVDDEHEHRKREQQSEARIASRPLLGRASARDHSPLLCPVSVTECPADTGPSSFEGGVVSSRLRSGLRRATSAVEGRSYAAARLIAAPADHVRSVCASCPSRSSLIRRYNSARRSETACSLRRKRSRRAAASRPVTSTPVSMSMLLWSCRRRAQRAWCSASISSSCVEWGTPTVPPLAVRAESVRSPTSECRSASIGKRKVTPAKHCDGWAPLHDATSRVGVQDGHLAYT